MFVSRFEKWVVLYIALSVASMFLIKVILFENCFAFDTNDDVNHTFVNLKVARDIMQHGALPNINLYDNFGTPILGDALTFPFSIQSITYWFFPNYIAMTVNRAVIGFLTIIFLYLFLRRFLNPAPAILASFIALFTPGVVWNLAHHHYQMSLLCFCALLYIQTCYLDWSRRKFLLFLWAGYCIFFLSASIQPLVLATPFLLIFPLIKDGFRSFRPTIDNFLAFIAGAIATAPLTGEFIQNIVGAIRLDWSPYTNILSTNREQLLALLVPAGEWMHNSLPGHFNVVSYFSAAVLLFAVVGLISLLIKPRINASLIRVIVFLGVIPAIGGYVLQFHGHNLPLIKGMDSTRIWWFSNVFVALAVGRVLDVSWNQAFTPFISGLIGLVTIYFIFIYWTLPARIPEFNEISSIYRVGFWGTVFGLLTITFYSVRRQVLSVHTARTVQHDLDENEDVVANISKTVILGVVLLALVPSLVQVMGLNRQDCAKGHHYFADKSEATFQPLSLLTLMESGYRMTSYTSNLVDSHDLRASFGGVLGSNSRDIISSRLLKEILLRNKLIEVSNHYSFSPPWQTKKLSRLGIRYILVRYQPNQELVDHGWKLISDDDHSLQGYYLYENPSKASLVYLLQRGAPTFLHNYEILPNGIRVLLPGLNAKAKLVVSFFARDSWHIYVDGREIAPQMNSLGMMEIPVHPGDRLIELEFQGLKLWNFLISFFLSAVVLLFTYLLPYLRNRAQNQC